MSFDSNPFRFNKAYSEAYRDRGKEDSCYFVIVCRDSRTVCLYRLVIMAAALLRMFGSGKKGELPSPQQAIQKLRETEEMLSKKTEFLEKKIDKEMQTVKKNGLKNKRGEPRLGVA